MSLSRSRTKLVHRLCDRKGRPREGAVLVEGVRGAEEALAAGVGLRFAAVTGELSHSARGRALLERLRDCEADVEEVEPSELASLSDTQEPQGVLLVVDEPGNWSVGEAGTRPILVADAVQDPGNLGTLARTARAFGLAGMVALDGTVDPWNPKCVRASAGALFHLGVVRMGWEEAREVFRREGRRLYAGAMGGRPVEGIVPEGPWALAIGNEGGGVRDALAAEGVAVSVPMAAGESLNAGVAGAILLYALSRSS